MAANEFYNRSSRDLQDRYDSRRLADQLVKTRLHHQLDEQDKCLIQASEFFFIATVDSLGRPDCSIKGGNPGFVSIEGDNKISFPNYDGNGMFRSLGNIHQNSNVGLLFLSFTGTHKKLRINGRAFVSESNEISGPEALKITIDIQDIFPNCPRYLPEFLQLSSSAYNKKEGYDAPQPIWKSKADLKEYLPRR